MIDNCAEKKFFLKNTNNLFNIEQLRSDVDSSQKNTICRWSTYKLGVIAEKQLRILQQVRDEITGKYDHEMNNFDHILLPYI